MGVYGSRGGCWVRDCPRAPYDWKMVLMCDEWVDVEFR